MHSVAEMAVADGGPAVQVPAVEVRDLHKGYGGCPAVRGIDLRVAQGEVFALLGPNGAGKTTTVEILEGYRGRDSGEVSVLGYDPARGQHALKARIGIVLQSTGIDTYLTAAETVELLGAAYAHRLPTNEVLELVGLSSERDQLVRKLSGGQRRRLDVAVAIVGDADLLFLDEPTTGFDPSARRAAWDLIKDLARRGKTIFLTTHYMEEAEYLADRVAIIAKGKIVAEGPPRQLGAQTTSIVSFRLPAGVPPLPEGLVPPTTQVEQVVSVTINDPTELLHDLTGWALAHGVHLEGLHVSQPSLEDIYPPADHHRRRHGEHLCVGVLPGRTTLCAPSGAMTTAGGAEADVPSEDRPPVSGIGAGHARGRASPGLAWPSPIGRSASR